MLTDRCTIVSITHKDWYTSQRLVYRYKSIGLFKYCKSWDNEKVYVTVTVMVRLLWVIIKKDLRLCLGWPLIN